MTKYLEVNVNLPASTTVSYKYIRKNDGTVTWEADPNREITTPSSASDPIIENDIWNGDSGNTISVTFNIQATTVLGGQFNGSALSFTDELVENIYIAGSVDTLENWSPDNALLLSSADYPTWSSKSWTFLYFR